MYLFEALLMIYASTDEYSRLYDGHPVFAQDAAMSSMHYSLAQVPSIQYNYTYEQGRT